MAGRDVRRAEWPEGRSFAFSILDDTDHMTRANGSVVYDFLTDLGLRVTKSVWPVGPTRPQTVGGSTCADPDYLSWVLDLQAAGHEIGYHNATDHSSTRSETLAALDRFEQLFGHPPRVGADHAGNRESLYCASSRVSGAWASVYRFAEARVATGRPKFSGEVPGSEYFWGDLCRERIDYWRGFTFTDIDLLRSCPQTPYHDPDRPYVNRWFTSVDAPSVESLLRRLQPEHLDDLECRGGACILYTHLGLDTVVDGRLDPRFVRAMTSLTERNGWFAPVSTVLDHLDRRRPRADITPAERRRLERRWILDRIRSGAKLGPVDDTAQRIAVLGHER